MTSIGKEGESEFFELCPKNRIECFILTDSCISAFLKEFFECLIECDKEIYGRSIGGLMKGSIVFMIFFEIEIIRTWRDISNLFPDMIFDTNKTYARERMETFIGTCYTDIDIVISHRDCFSTKT